MAQLMDHIKYLSQEIGPRPAGTEEEQRAALYITEQFQKETGFTASMEDFSSSSNVEMGLAAMAGIVVIATVLAIIFPVLAIPAFILAAAAAAVYSLEQLDKPIISRVLARGASQNVVAKYQPASDGEPKQSRRGSSRKIVLMAHYDTGNVQPAVVAQIENMKIPVPLVCVAAIIAAAFFLLIRIFVASGGGMALLVLNVLSIVAVIICLYPIVKAALIRTSPYNEGATNNATGTAALLEVARRIAHGSVSEAELADTADNVVIHGEAAAREAGLIPEGVQLIYEAEEQVVQEAAPVAPELEEYDEEERLLSAKAAIAALTGKPVENKIYSTVTPSHESSRPQGVDAIEGEIAYDESEPPFDESYYGENYIDDPRYADYGIPDYYTTDSAEGFENAPSWFVAAQQNARKPESEQDGKDPQIKRSKYTEAITTAERNLALREEEMEAAKREARLAAQRAREEEFRAMIAAKEAEKAAAAERERQAMLAEYASVEQGAPQVQGNEMAQPYNQDVPSPYVPIDVQPVAETPTRPDSTIAMVAPTPSAEIIAEALAADAAAAAPAITPDDIPSPKVALDASAIPVPNPAADQTAPTQVAVLPAIDPANPYAGPVEPAPETRRPSLAENVPAIDSATPAPTDEPSRSGILRKLRANIPSLSGLMSPVSTGKRESVSAAPADKVDYNMEVPLGGGAPAPVPAVTDASTVDIPRSRSGSFLNRIRQNEGEKLADTPQQWLDVDNDFDPRRVGRDRGGWESFQEGQRSTQENPASTAAENTEAATPTPRRWQGGAYSRVQLGHVDTRSGEDTEADKPIMEEQMPDVEKEPPIAEEIEQIYHFRNPQFGTEVWFVAIGADGESHDGARAFIEEHRDELRGAMMIEVESLGAGSLSVASEEGRVRKAVVSSRVKRYTRAATAATGLAVSSVSLVGTDSIASTLQKAGFQAMHIFGAENGRPALKGSADDVVENVDELALEEHVDFIYELLKR